MFLLPISCLREKLRRFGINEVSHLSGEFSFGCMTHWTDCSTFTSPVSYDHGLWTCKPHCFGLLFGIMGLSERGTGSITVENTALGVTPPSLLTVWTADSSIPPLSSSAYLRCSFFKDSVAYGTPQAQALRFPNNWADPLDDKWICGSRRFPVGGAEIENIQSSCHGVLRGTIYHFNVRAVMGGDWTTIADPAQRTVIWKLPVRTTRSHVPVDHSFPCYHKQWVLAFLDTSLTIHVKDKNANCYFLMDCIHFN